MQDYGTPSNSMKYAKPPLGLLVQQCKQRKRHALTTRLLIRPMKCLILLALTFAGWPDLCQLSRSDVSANSDQIREETGAYTVES